MYKQQVRTLVAIAVTTLVAGLVPAVTGSATAAAPERTSPVARAAAIAWHDCLDDDLDKAGAECGRLSVPLDPAAPSGAKITVAVSRVLHTQAPYRGAVFTNPGGPGGSGLYMATFGAAVPDGVGKTFDWYGMDPRGVGASRPVLSCNGQYAGFHRPGYVPKKNGSNVRAWRTKAAAYAKACSTSSARRLLPHLRTTDNVADFEALREAIGAEKVSFYGASYGTYIAQTYATLHPDRLDRIVMDGVMDAKRAYYDTNLDQDRAFDKVLGRFFGWIGARDRSFHLGKGKAAVRASYYRLLAQVTRKPAGGKIGPAELTDALTPAGYSVGTWGYTAQGLADLDQGRPALIRRIFRFGNPVGRNADNGYAVYLATQCSDARWPTSWPKWKRDNTRLHRTAPFLTWSNAWFNMPCRTWPVKGGPKVAFSGSGVTGKVLLISETGDAATPFSGALATRRLFPTASLVAGVRGTTHAAGLSGIACVDDTIATYLRTGVVPARKPGNQADRRCGSVKPPARAAAKLPTPTTLARLSRP